VRRSSIHGGGLFAAEDYVFEKDQMIVEYIGQCIRPALADRREVQYEVEGVGSCYLFRLDRDGILDATRRGGMARFINHSCDPNAYAKVIESVETRRVPVLRKVVVAAPPPPPDGEGDGEGDDGEDGDSDDRMDDDNGGGEAPAAASASSSKQSHSVDDGAGTDAWEEVMEDVETHEKHIVIFAARDILGGEEITYDYKFPIEEKKLRCYCGAPSCLGSMN
jgi:SET domain-containing protein